MATSLTSLRFRNSSPGIKRKQDVCINIRPFLKRRNIRFIEGVVTDIQDGGRTVIANGETYKNDALFVGIGSALLEDDTPGTKEHTLSPCYGTDDMETFMRRLESRNNGVIYLGFKISSKGSIYFICGICEAVNHVYVKWFSYREYFDPYRRGQWCGCYRHGSETTR